MFNISGEEGANWRRCFKKKYLSKSGFAKVFEKKKTSPKIFRDSKSGDNLDVKGASTSSTELAIDVVAAEVKV